MRNVFVQQALGEAPWYVVPVDDKENARLIVSRIVLDPLEGHCQENGLPVRRGSA